MPYATEIVEDGRGIIFRGSGILSEDELVEVRMALKSNPDATRRLCFARIDLENVDELRLDQQGVRRIAAIDELLSKLATSMFVGIIAPKDHIFGIARMWEGHATETGWPIRVVRSQSEANAWFSEMLAVRRENEREASSKPGQHDRDSLKTIAASTVITDLVSERHKMTHTCELGLNGCFVPTTTPFKEGANVRIAIVYTGAKVEAFGHVTYTQAQGMGIAFNQMDPKYRAILDRWMNDLQAVES